MKSLGNVAAFGEACGSPVLAAGQRVIESIKLTTGIGNPDTGMRFGVGAQGFAAAVQTLTMALPENGWTGAGSTAYRGRNDKLRGDSQTMADADRLVASVLSREAEQIAVTRDGLDRQSDWLGQMSLIACAVGALSPAGRAAQAKAEMEMVAKAVGESTSQLMTMRDQVTVNAAEVRDAVSLYAAITADPERDGDDDPAPTLGELTEEPTESEEAAGDETAEPTADTAGPAPAAASASVGAAGPPSPNGPAAAPPASAPVTVPSQSAPAATASPAAPGGDVAGALAGVIGPIIGSIAGIIGGIAQAAGQAAQIATQSAGQAAQAGQADQSADPIGADSVNGTGSADEFEKRDNGKDDESGEDDRGATAEPPGEDELTEALPDAGPDGDSAGEGDDGPAMTLPPDFGEASTGMAGQEPQAAYVSTDLEHGQLRRPVPATLERGIPGSAAALTG
ncbi:EspA/EspE family type VII secretion system effector [Mycolicibacterium sp. HK-90]|uniref:EspA/EspE family type VII secretion system effector n=1 Tax=Mycolicibacterium sp. HK-90 TaxID=3056937 RepID=UPI002658F7E9|nr:EspA/EspE family type VII secretion system effector [Mycolicibacterium sp. HK-90]WKG03625.1 EspA/EspE family type VII secretion system effector [Mycolicibacterium sp. HK-90]